MPIAAAPVARISGHRIGGLISATLLTLFVLPTLYARFGAPGMSVSPNGDPPL